MADPFSYDSDIAPLRGNNFGAGILTPAGQEYQRRLDEQSTLRVAEIQAAANRQRLAFQQQQLELSRAAEAAKLEREALIAVPEVTKQLDSVMKDSMLDDATKATKIAELKYQFAGPATSSKQINNLFTAAEGTLATRKVENDRTNALAYALAQTGQADAVKKLYEGKTNPMANEYIGAAEAISAAKKEEATQRGHAARQKELMKRETTQQTAQIGLLNNYIDTLRKLEPERIEAGEAQIGTLKDGTPTTTIPQIQPFKFAKENRIEVEEIMRDLNPMLENEDMTKYSDEDLYRAAVRSTTSSLKKLSGFDSGFRSDKFRSTPSQ